MIQKYQFEENHMDTRVTMTIFSERDQEIVAENCRQALDVFRELENKFSLFRDNSEIVGVNKQAGKICEVSLLMIQVIEYALKMAAETGGIFNPLVGGFTAPHVGEISEIADYASIQVDVAAQTVAIPAGTALDLNSIVKGLALDLAMKCFLENEKIMIEAGGDIRLQVAGIEDSSWKIGIRNPTNPTKIVTVLELFQGAICTSGNYFRSKKVQSAGRLHLVAPQTFAGNPTPQNSIQSMTVIAPTAQQADVLSTAAFFMPIVQAIEFVEKYHQSSCLIIDSQDEIYMSPRMKNYFNLSPSLCLN